MRHAIACSLLASLAACGPSEPAGQSASPVAIERSAEELQAQVSTLASPYNEASYEAGRRAFAQCRSCHTIAADAGNRVGPNLHGLFTREIGAAEGFTYSQAAQDANFVWTAEQLDRWLQNPQTFLPGNRMAFAGVQDEAERRDLIAYIMIQSAAD